MACWSRLLVGLQQRTRPLRQAVLALSASAPRSSAKRPVADLPRSAECSKETYLRAASTQFSQLIRHPPQNICRVFRVAKVQGLSTPPPETFENTPRPTGRTQERIG